MLVRPDEAMTHGFLKLPSVKTKPKIDTGSQCFICDSVYSNGFGCPPFSLLPIAQEGSIGEPFFGDAYLSTDYITFHSGIKGQTTI